MSRRYRIAGTCVTRTIGEETILVPVRSSVVDLDSVYTLNEVGIEIWAGLTAGKGADEIVATLAAEFAVDPAVARADLDRFLSDLEGEGLIEVEAS